MKEAVKIYIKKKDNNKCKCNKCKVSKIFFGAKKTSLGEKKFFLEYFLESNVQKKNISSYLTGEYFDERGHKPREN